MTTENVATKMKLRTMKELEKRQDNGSSTVVHVMVIWRTVAAYMCGLSIYTAICICSYVRIYRWTEDMVNKYEYTTVCIIWLMCIYI